MKKNWSFLAASIFLFLRTAQAEELYDSVIRSSEYVEVRDGTKIAVDIFRPMVGENLHSAPLPAVWMFTPYFRALQAPNGIIISIASSPIGRAFAYAGYVLVIADIRGTGASFGVQEGIFTPTEGRDGYDITEWIAYKPWCDGNVGMIGGSYNGIIQLITAAENPPHLKAIFPAMALFDLYSLVYHGGILFDDFLIEGDQIQQLQNQQEGRFVAPVGDSDSALVEQARKGHLINRGRRALYTMFSPLPYRDSVDTYTGQMPYMKWSPSGRIDEIRQAGIAVYVYGGWFDLFPKDAVLLYANLAHPKKLALVDTAHKGRSSEELLTFYINEQTRWFDYWLKGIDNGIMDEPPVTLQKTDDLLEEIIRLESWPPAESETKVYYFREGPSGTSDLVNDGKLSPEKPGSLESPDIYTVNRQTTTGKTSRWANANKKNFFYPDMSSNDSLGLTYTTAPLSEPLTLLGHPVISLWCSVNQEEADIFAYLEDVSSDGTSRYLTEGWLRASHRALAEAPYENLGLPYHSHSYQSVEPVPVGEPVRLFFDLLPVFYSFQAGHSLRLTITGADKDNAHSSNEPGERSLKVLHSREYPSSIHIPVKLD